MITREKALAILDEHIKNKNLTKHCLAVEAAMRGLYQYLYKDHNQTEEDKWALVGLMHDADWEETRGDYDLHTRKTVEWLKQAGETDEEVFRAILAHNFNHNKELPPQSPMEWSLYICDELTGLIVAVALILPDKKLASVTIDNVLKRFPQKKFAAGVHREQIQLCEEKLSIPLPEFIFIILTAMQNRAHDLGL